MTASVPSARAHGCRAWPRGASRDSAGLVIRRSPGILPQSPCYEHGLARAAWGLLTIRGRTSTATFRRHYGVVTAFLRRLVGSLRAVSRPTWDGAVAPRARGGRSTAYCLDVGRDRRSAARGSAGTQRGGSTSALRLRARLAPGAVVGVRAPSPASCPPRPRRPAARWRTRRPRPLPARPRSSGHRSDRSSSRSPRSRRR
jgi:hypothetical protein